MSRPAVLSLSSLESREVPAAGMLADIMPDVWGSYPRDITPAGNTLFFSAEDRAAGRELWATDGTTAGTHLVKDIVPGRAGSNPTHFLAAGDGRIFFTADTGTGPTLWSSDGTAAGTVNLGLKNGVGPSFAAGNGILYVMADDGSGSALWRTDGTAAGTTKVTGVPDALRLYQTSSTASTGSILAQYGDGTIGWKGELYFVTQDLATNKLTWAKTNGTGFTVLTDFNGDTSPQEVHSSPVSVVGNRLEFVLRNAAGQPMVWQTDGTPGGTQLLEQDVTVTSPATGAVTLPVLTGVEFSPGSFLYVGFSGTPAQPKTSVWAGDGRTAGSFQLLQSFDGASIPSIRLAGGKAYFTVFGAGSGSLWVTDGTPAGTRKIDAITNTFTDAVKASVGGKAVVQRDYYGGRYWLTDGTSAGTSLLPVPAGTENLMWGFVGTLPPDAANPNGSLLFQEIRDGKVYRTDGTAAGTALVDLTGLPPHQTFRVPISVWQSVSSGIALSGLDPTFRDGVGTGAFFKGAVYYSGKTDVQRAELWKWDITATAPAVTAPKVTGTVVNDGSVQRSMVKTLTVKFDSAVNVAPTGVTITGTDGRGATVITQTATVNGITTLTLTFPADVGGSIPDGRYTLKIAASAVTRQNGGPAMASDYTFGFTRLYGDVTGDGIYDRDVRMLVKSLLGQHEGDAGYRADLDVNSDGKIDNTDELAAIRNWGKAV